MGDSFTVEPGQCGEAGCGRRVTFVIDAGSVRAGERARVECSACGVVNILRRDGSVEVAADVPLESVQA